MTLRYGYAQAVGKRANQEDRFLCAPEMGIFAVADGLGGHERGEEAAQAAVDALRTFFVALSAVREAGVRVVLDGNRVAGATGHVRPEATPTDLLHAAIMSAHHAVSEIGPRRFSGNSPATTLTVLWLAQPGRVWIGHVGDSRCYRLKRAGNKSALACVTEDHTNGWGLNQAVGLRVPEPQITPLDAKGRWLLCTDGLYGALEVPVLRRLLQGDPIDASAQQMVDQALSLDHPQQDNLTAVVVEVDA